MIFHISNLETMTYIESIQTAQLLYIDVIYICMNATIHVNETKNWFGNNEGYNQSSTINDNKESHLLWAELIHTYYGCNKLI